MSRIPVILAALLAVAPAGLLAAPAQLYGKSVILRWQENRTQKHPGDDEMQHPIFMGEFDIYVSTTGRAFSRLTMSKQRRRGLRSGSSDAVQGGGSARNFSFQGTNAQITIPRGGGATQMNVSFDPGFQSCTADTRSGKTGGAAFMRGRAFQHGREIDMYKIETSRVTCAIQPGNIFGPSN